MEKFNAPESFDHTEYVDSIKQKYLTILMKMKKWEKEVVEELAASQLADIFCLLIYCSRSNQENEQIFYRTYETLAEYVSRIEKNADYKNKIKNVIKNANFNTIPLDLGLPFVPNEIIERLLTTLEEEVPLCWFGDVPDSIALQKPHFN